MTGKVNLWGKFTVVVKVSNLAIKAQIRICNTVYTF
jgi:hypothetical protein